MDKQSTDVELSTLSNDEIDRIFKEWYRKPIWVHVDGEYQVVNRNELLAVIRTFRKLRGY